jgi:hypothetical protein
MPFKEVPYPTIRDRLLQPALTTHYTVDINFNEGIRNWIDEKFKSILNGSSLPQGMQEILSVSCCDATLPGSTFFTHEIQNDRTGVTEKIPYRRVYDDQASFTFYVSTNYSTLVFFEGWMSYIAKEEYGTSPGVTDVNYSYRMRYPEERDARNNYRVNMSITKFEKNHQLPQNLDKSRETVRDLKYNFVDAYPLAITSIPVSYESASALTVTVSFAFTRYYLG